MSETTSELSAVNVQVEVRIEAPRERVFETLVDRMSDWWHEDFFTRPGLGAYRLERKLGGLVYEDWGDGEGQIWGKVAGLKAPEYLQVAGDTDHNWGGPSRGIMTYTLEADGDATLLRFVQASFGHVSEETRRSLEEGWRLLLGDCLKPFAERG